MDAIRILYVTAKDRDEARFIGRFLVEKQLCACVNILGSMESIYPWEGAVQSDTECVLLVKTTKQLAEAATNTIIEQHSYELPCVISLPIQQNEGNSEYLSWISKTVQHPN